MHTIITIARQTGAGGSETARILAELLGINCYERNLLSMAAEKSGLSESALTEADEKAPSSLLYSFVMGAQAHHSTVSHLNMPLNDRLFTIQSEIIRDLAEKESCIIVGHCADYILDEHPSVISVFLHGNPEIRARRLAEAQGLRESEARDTVSS